VTDLSTVDARTVRVTDIRGSRTGALRRLCQHTWPSGDDQALLRAWADEAASRYAGELARQVKWTRPDADVILRSVADPGPASSDTFLVQNASGQPVGIIALTAHHLNFAFRCDAASETSVMLDAAVALAALLDLPLAPTDMWPSGERFWRRLCKRMGWSRPPAAANGKPMLPRWRPDD